MPPPPPHPEFPPPMVLEMRPLILEICGMSSTMINSLAPRDEALNLVAAPLKSQELTHELRIIQAEVSEQVFGVSHEQLQIRDIRPTVAFHIEHPASRPWSPPPQSRSKSLATRDWTALKWPSSCWR